MDVLELNMQTATVGKSFQSIPCAQNALRTWPEGSRLSQMDCSQSECVCLDVKDGTGKARDEIGARLRLLCGF